MVSKPLSAGSSGVAAEHSCAANPFEPRGAGAYTGAQQRPKGPDRCDAAADPNRGPKRQWLTANDVCQLSCTA